MEIAYFNMLFMILIKGVYRGGGARGTVPPPRTQSYHNFKILNSRVLFAVYNWWFEGSCLASHSAHINERKRGQKPAVPIFCLNLEKLHEKFDA